MYNYRTAQLNKIKWYLLLAPATAGLILACASIPFIIPAGVVCTIAPPTDLVGVLGHQASWGPFLGIFLIPAWLVILTTTVAFGRVCWHVRQLNKRAEKWRLPAGNSTSRLQQPPHSDSSWLSSLRSRARRLSVKKPTSRAKKAETEVFVQSAMYLGALYVSWSMWLVGVSCRYKAYFVL